MIEAYRVLISATSEEEADKILDALTQKRIIAGGLISQGKSRYWWNDKIVEKNYFNISTFTTIVRKEQLKSEVKRLHSDETPIIAFFKIDDGNDEFLKWIEENT